MKILRSLPQWALAGAVLSVAAIPVVGMAQSAAPVRPAVRIVTAIDESQLVTLKGNVNPHAIAKYDRGPVSGSFALPDLTLVLSRGAQEQAAFDAYVASEYDSSSPNYHQWLMPAEIGQRFGPAQADIAAVTSWLASHGFVVKTVAPDGMTIRFGGTAAQVASAFHTEIHNLNVNGAAHYANMTDPQIPAALAPVVLGIKALHNFLPHPLHKVGSIVQFNQQAGKWQRVGTPAVSKLPALLHAGTLSRSLAAGGAHTEFGYNGNVNGQTYLEEDIAPYDFAKIYNLPSGWPTSNNGSGQTIAVAGTSMIDAADVTGFRTAFDLPAGPALSQIDTGDGPAATECSGSTAVCNSGDLLENSLDVEWSGAVAPGAQIDLVVTGNNANGTIDASFDSAQYVVTKKLANILSISYGLCELGEGTAGNVAYYDLWQSAAAEGIAVFAAAGDSGSPSCDQDLDAFYGNPYSAQYGLSVSGIASTPFDTAVGGTDFTWCQPTINSSGNVVGCPASSISQGSPAYWATSNNTSAGFESALGYIPEQPWNDSCDSPIIAAYLESVATVVGVNGVTTPELACNFVLKDYASIYQNYEAELWPYVDTVGGGGGQSNCVVNDGNDVSSCDASTTSTGSDYGNIPLTNDGWQKPSWQANVTGIPSDGVRDLPDVSFFAGDGTLSSATLVCAEPVSGYACAASASGESGALNYSSNGDTTAIEVGGTSVATPEMAGVMALIDEKAGSPQGNPNTELYRLAGMQTYSSCSSETGTTSSACYFNDIDKGTIGMPCDYGAAEGGVVNQGGQPEFTSTTAGIVSPNCAALSAGDTIGTLVTTSGSTTEGWDAGTGYDLATGLGSLNVANVLTGWPTVLQVMGTNTATVTVTPGAGSLNSNTTLSVAVKVTGSAGTATGTVVLTAGSYTATGTLSSGSYTFTVPAYTFTASGTATVTANYSGDSNYAAATGTATVTVTYVPPPTYAISAATANPSTVAPGSTATSSISGQTSSSGYSGTVSFNTCTLTSATVANPTDAPTCTISGSITYTSGTPSGTATATVNTTAATAELVYPKVGNGKGRLTGLMGTGGGAVLAFLVFLGVPSRRRSWRAMLGMVVLLVALGGLAACGGGSSPTSGGSSTGSGSTGGSGSTTSGGTTAAQYTFTVMGVGNDRFNTTATATFTVTVN